MLFYWLIFLSNAAINSIKPRHLALQVEYINSSAVRPECLCSHQVQLSVCVPLGKLLDISPCTPIHTTKTVLHSAL